MEGNSVVGAIINTALATLITLTVLTLSFSAYHTLMIRDAAISAAARAGRVQAPEQNKYLLKLLDSSLPDLASYQLSPISVDGFVGVSVVSELPSFGLIPAPQVRIEALAPRERVS